MVRRQVPAWIGAFLTGGARQPGLQSSVRLPRGALLLGVRTPQKLHTWGQQCCGVVAGGVDLLLAARLAVNDSPLPPLGEICPLVVTGSDQTRGGRTGGGMVRAVLPGLLRVPDGSGSRAFRPETDRCNVACAGPRPPRYAFYAAGFVTQTAPGTSVLPRIFLPEQR